MNNNHCPKGIESPRIYTYKITFKDTPYYYYGVHKEKRFNEEYLGTPVTNKWCWDLYEAERQILEVFPNTDEGWIYANKVEQRLILPVFNSDPNCLNENCGGVMSLEQKRRISKKTYSEGKGLASLTKEQRREISKKTWKEGKGLASLTKEQRQEYGRISGNLTYQNKTGLHSRTFEQMSEQGKKNAKKLQENGKGIFALTKEQRSEIGKKTYEQGIGLHSLTKEQRQEIGRRNGKNNYEKGIGIASISKEQMQEQGRNWGKKGSKKTNTQKWKCLVTGFISTSGPLTHYQKNRGIDTSKRVRIA